MSKWDNNSQALYESSLKEVENWEKTDILYLETLMYQNQLLLKNIENLKQEFKEKTEELKLQNDELLNMNKYLVATTERAEEERRLALERKEKRRKAKKQNR